MTPLIPRDKHPRSSSSSMRTAAVRECDYERFGGEIPPNGEFAGCTFTLPTYLSP
jgi:hypothetical protein